MALIYGIIAGAGTASRMQLQQLSFGEESSVVKTFDQSGNVAEIKVCGRTKTIQCEGNLISGSTIPASGDQITVNQETFVIDQVRILEVNGSHRTAVIHGCRPFSSSN